MASRSGDQVYPTEQKMVGWPAASECLSQPVISDVRKFDDRAVAVLIPSKNVIVCLQKNSNIVNAISENMINE